MNPISLLVRTPNRRIAWLAALVLALDQCSKALVLQLMGYAEARVVVPGFFKFVNWQNTGAAWSLFQGSNALLAIVAVAALLFLFLGRRHFDSHTLLGQVAFGLIIGGIMGNLVDRLFRHHVIDFIRFYIQPRGGSEIGFPAFNIADTAICTGVGLIFLLTLKNDRAAKSPEPSASG